MLDGNSNWRPLEFRTQDELDQLYSSNTNTGIPESFNVEGLGLTVHPTPDTSYRTKIRVITAEPDLGGSGSTPVMPTVFHSAIVEAALLLMYETLQDGNRVGQQEQKVKMWVDRMKGYGVPYESSPRIRVRDWL